MCESQPTWPVHLSGWHHCTHTPSISARRHRTMLLLVINIHTSLAVLHAPHPLSACTLPLLLLHTATNKQMHTLLEPLYLTYVHSGCTVSHTDCPFTQFGTHGWSPVPPSHPYKLCQIVPNIHCRLSYQQHLFSALPNWYNIAKASYVDTPSTPLRKGDLKMLTFLKKKKKRRKQEERNTC